MTVLTKLSAPCLSLLTAGLLLSAPLSAQDSTIKRTEYGFPDFQGFFTYRTITPLQRPPELADKATLTPEEAAEWEAYENQRQNRDLIVDSVGGAGYPPGVISYNEFWYERGSETIESRRTSLIYDPPNGRMPERTPEGIARGRDEAMMRKLSLGVEARPLAERCLMSFGGTVPMVPKSYNNNLQIVQTKDHIMILNEMIHLARVIPFAEEFSGNPKWEGDSIARWEGDTLVIETQDFYYYANYSGATADMKLVERISWVDEDTLEYDFTIEDPNTWTQPWSARLPLSRSADPVYEYACHEGNHGLAGVMAGWRRYESMGLWGDGSPRDGEVEFSRDAIEER